MNLKTAVLASALAAGCAAPVKTVTGDGSRDMDAPSRFELAERVSGGWAENSRLAARAMLSRYGAPDEVGSSSLLWRGNGPWKRTIVRDVPRPYAGGGEDLGVIEQTVDFESTPELAAVLAEFGDRLRCDPAARELSSRADREEVNRLRLNLANDVAHELLSSREAAETYERMLKLEGAGKTVRYMLSLNFGKAP